jgi:tight adherence protein B
MHGYALPLVLACAALSGAGWWAVLAVERRRKALRLRLAALAAPRGMPAAAPPLPPLRRPRSGDRFRRLYLLPTVMLTWLERVLETAGRRIRLSYLAALGLAAAAAAELAAFAIMPLPPGPACALAGAAAVGAPALLLHFAERRYRQRFLDIFPDALDMIARAVRAGLPPLEAIEVSAREMPSPIRAEFTRVLDEMRIGVEMENALQQAFDRVRIPDFGFFVACLVLHRRTGGALAENLSNLSALIRQRHAARRRARALVAEAKASAAIMAVMPLVATAGLFLIDRPLMSGLLMDPRGRTILMLAFGSLAVGIALMAVMVKRNSY